MALELHPSAKENQELHKRYKDARSDWETDARNDIDFYHGNHFTTDESNELQSRNQADVPMDRISPAIEKLKSVLTAKPPVFTAIPREDSDTNVSGAWRTILGYMWEISNGDVHMKNAIHDYAVTGLGYLYVYIDNESDFGKGEVKFTSINPFRVYVPPSSRDRFFQDADSVILSTILTGTQLINLYPFLGPQVDEETGELIPGIVEELSTYREEDYPYASNKNSMQVFTPDVAKDLDNYQNERYQILERFFKTKVPFYRVVDTRSGEEMILNEQEFAAFLEENPGVFERGLMSFEEVLQTRIGVVATVGEVVLYETILSTDVYPIVPLPNLWSGTPYPKSDVSRTRPMQRLLNKLWSLALSHAQASAGLKLLVPLGSAVNGLDQLEKDWANPNAVIEVDTSQGEPHYPAPTPLASEFYRLIDQAEFYIDFIFGLPEMMHGFSEKAPQTVRGTERMMMLGSERPKSKLRDIEFSINILGRIMYAMAKGHYTFKKIFRLIQPNNNINEITANFYTSMEETVIDIAKDRNHIGQHDVRIEPGSTLPTSKWAEYGVYFEAYQAGLVDRTEVLKKNPEIFDKESILSRMSEIAQLQQSNASLEQQIKALQGDLQTAQRESVQDKKRVAVEKFKRDLTEVRADAKANKKVQTNRFADTVKFELEKLKPLADNMNNVMQSGDSSALEDSETL
tara:strand:+ start:3304 stop:5361 length:2058 start_codon:yes stop_codon:yes gene_type:complete